MKLKITLLGATVIALVALVTFSNAGCKKDDTCDTTSVSYKDDIVPLLKDKGCTTPTCHGATSALPYATYAELKAEVDTERLLGAVKREVGFSPMPKIGDKIDACSISILEAWIKQGAKNN
jgi:hypothetical protein